MAEDMRAKSTRREAVWRQQTLKAVYTASDAKQSVNVIAALIVDDIVDQIKHFSDPNQTGAITAAVRSIVKVAAETWRYARLERELITAAMPAVEDDRTPYEDWSEHEYQEYPPPDGAPPPEQQERQCLLRLLPHIVREAIHEDYPVDEDKHSSGPCIYLGGKALYSDSPPVMARMQELMQRAIDPSGTTTSRPQSGVFSAGHSDSPTTSSHPPAPSESTVSNDGPSVYGGSEPSHDQPSDVTNAEPAPSEGGATQTASDASVSQTEGSVTTGASDDTRSETTARPTSVVNGVQMNGDGPGAGPPQGPPDWGSANP
jgi:hypothetical protein